MNYTAILMNYTAISAQSYTANVTDVSYWENYDK